MSIETRSNQYGNLFGHWQIQKMLGSGSGGKSAVFQLRRKGSQWEEYSALKVVSLIEERGIFSNFSQFRKNEYVQAVAERKEEALQEVRLMEQLRGKTNIVDYLDYRFEDWEDDSGFGCDLLIRMELLDGLRNTVRYGKIFTEAEIIKVGLDICDALIICHGKSILHRDIKPENIFFNRDGDYKLGDFGISRIMSSVPSAMASTGVGTPEYAAPEQSSGKYDKRVDIYSLGIVLYELGNQNRLPFASSGYVRPDEVQKRYMGLPLPKPCGVDDDLAAVILKACAFKPEDRYHTAQELKRELIRLQDLTEEVYAPTISIRHPKPAADQYATMSAVVQTPEQDDYGTLAVSREHFEDSYGTMAAAKSDFGTIFARAEEGDDYGTIAASHFASADDYSTMSAAGQNSNDATIYAKGDSDTFRTVSIGNRVVIRKDDFATMRAEPQTVPVQSEKVPVPMFPAPERPKQKFFESIDQKDYRTIAVGAVCAGLLLGGLALLKGKGAENEQLAVNETESVAVTQSIETAPPYTIAQESIPVETSPPETEPVLTLGDIMSRAIIGTGRRHTAFLRSDGTAAVVGGNQYGQRNVYSWTDLIAIAAGDHHTVGLKADGTVVAAGSNQYKQCEVSSWSNVKIIAAGDYHTVALCNDGTLLATGWNTYSQCDVQPLMDVAVGKEIVSVAAGYEHTVALYSDGTVKAIGRNDYGQCNVSGWSNVIAVFCGTEHTVGLCADGTVLATGLNKDGQCNVSDWMDIVFVACGDYYTVGIKEDGTLVTTGQNKRGQCNLDGWSNIVAVSGGCEHTVAITEDGSVLAIGWNEDGQCNVSGVYY